MTNEKLIAYYTANLEKVKGAWGDDWRGAEYIEYAEKQLEAVKRGGIEELKRFWNAN